MTASVLTVAPGIPFAQGFARGFWARHAAIAPEAVARIRVLVNAPRTLRAIEDALVESAPGSALLPRLEVLADLGADPLACPDLAPVLDPLRRRLRLIQLVEAYLGGNPAESAPLAAAPAMAEALEALLDQCDEAGLEPDALDMATEGQHAVHWQRTLAFVDLVRRVWPEIRAEAEGGRLDAKARQRAVIMDLIAGMEAGPPADPVIVAGSTGAVLTTGLLMAAIARLPQGVIVLPGFDRGLPDDIWAQLATGTTPEHPQAPFAPLLTTLGLEPADVAPWTPDAPQAERLALLTQALRPAPVTDAWHAEAPALAPSAAAALSGMTLVEAETPRQEAAAIAVAIRMALAEPALRVALVTPDAAVARRVTAELERYDILPDDSLGRSVAQSPPGVFLRLIASVALDGADPVRLAGLLQHPLMQPGCARRDHLRFARRYDLGPLRRPPPGWTARDGLAPWPDRSDGTPPDPEAVAWLGRIRDALAPLTQALRAGAPLEGLAQAHVAAAEALSREAPDAPPAVWERRAGGVAFGLMAALTAQADAHGAGAMAAYPALVLNLMRDAEVRPDPATPHPRVTILGPREARAASADLVILAGLNDGIWPALPGVDPWLSRPMRAAVGLPQPERQIGLSAHDFYHAALRGRVILTRARKVAGAPTVASRWLIRLENLCSGLDGGTALVAARARGDALLVRARAVHAPLAVTPRAIRPMPSPDRAVRPRKLSVTQVETLVRDAYAVYAREVLRLRPLEPLGRPPDARERGTVFHTILERFVAQTADGLPEPEAARSLLFATADAVLDEQVPWPDLRRIWRGRLTRFAGWFLETEGVRRQDGRPLAWEVRGEIVLNAPGGPFRLVAKADRIDLRAGGTAAIYDYKTGSPPTKKQIDIGLNHQLHIQAAILGAGGFEGIAPVRAGYGAYLGLTGTDEGGSQTERIGLGDEVAAHMDKVLDLLAAYDHGAAYAARGWPEKAAEDGDYDHLSRRDEWEDTE